jgi:hypothetical protein
MRRYILALITALVLAGGAYTMNRGITGPPPPPQRELPAIPRDIRLR